MLVWTQRPDRLGFSVVDTIFGSADFPGELRAAAQLLLNYKNCVIRAARGPGRTSPVMRRKSAFAGICGDEAADDTFP